MNKKVILIIVGAVILLAISVLIALNNNSKIQPAEPGGGLILFYSTACPHCLKVEQFMADNKVEEKIKIDKREVGQDKTNAELLGAKAGQCGLNIANIGVPFLWNGPEAKCLIGDVEIINFFQQKLNQQNEKK